MNFFVMSLSMIALSNAFLFENSKVSREDLLMEFGQANYVEFSTSPDFVLTCWNVYKGGIQGMHDDLQQIIESSDFVLMQEFLLDSTQEIQMQAMDNHHWAVAKSFKDGGAWTGVATVSRWHAYESIPLRSPGTEPFSNTPKMSLVTKYKLATGDDLWLVNIHGLNFDLTHNAFKTQIDAVVKVLEAHDGPMIFAGDFNTWSDVRLQYLLNATKALHMERAPIENPIGIMYATLDHIFYRGFSSVKSSLLTDYESSDHTPLRLEFSLATDASRLVDR